MKLHYSLGQLYTFDGSNLYEVVDINLGITLLRTDGLIRKVIPAMDVNSFMSTAKLVKEAIPAQVDGLFQERTTNQLYRIEKVEGRLVSIRNLKTGVGICFRNDKNQIYRAFKFFNYMPRIHQAFKCKNTKALALVKSIQKDKITYMLHGNLYTVSIIEFLNNFTLDASFTCQWACEMGKQTSVLTEHPVFDFTRPKIDWGALNKYSEDDIKLAAVDIKNELRGKFGRMVRPIKTPFFYIDIDVCDKPPLVASLFPQVGDVYKSKFHGIEVTVLEVKRKRFLVTDGHKEWKMGIFAFAGQWVYVRSGK
jgi:hypothetical protein